MSVAERNGTAEEIQAEIETVNGEVSQLGFEEL